MNSSEDNQQKALIVSGLVNHVFNNLLFSVSEQMKQLQKRNCTLSNTQLAPFWFQGTNYNPLEVTGTMGIQLNEDVVPDVIETLAEIASLRKDEVYVRTFLSAVLNRYDSQPDILRFIPEPLEAKAKDLMHRFIVPEDSEIDISDVQVAHLLRVHGKAIIIIKERLLDKLLL